MVESVCFLTGQAYTIAEWTGLDEPTCIAGAGEWQQLPTDLENLFITYFKFDSSLMDTIIGGSIIALAIGLSTGFVVAMMRKT